MDASSTSAGGAVAGVVFLVILVALYFLPLVVAALRQVPNIGSVAIVNIFLGWTFIGWVVALAMACRSADRNVIVNQYGTGMPVGAQAASPLAAAFPPGWFADPSTRHELRYWNGMGWTDHVSDAGVQTVDASR